MHKYIMSEAEYTHALDQIVNYLTVRGIECNLHSNAFAYYREEDRITCSSKSHGTVSMICGLLHEAGHAIQNKSIFTTLRKSTKRDICIILEQEYKAWESGLQIARECNINSEWLLPEYIKSWYTSWSQYIIAVTAQPLNQEYISRVYTGYGLNPGL